MIEQTSKEEAMKKGTRFLHSKWLNTQFSIEEVKTLPREQVAQLFVVTRIAKGNCYYRSVHNLGSGEFLGSAYYHPVSDMEKYVLRVVATA